MEDPEFSHEYVIPVEKILGPRTLRIVQAPEKVQCLILRKTSDYSRGRKIGDFVALTERRSLNDSQIETLRKIITDPESYWNGWPKYRRYPPRPGFAFEIFGAKSAVHLLVDLQNPGWEFSCDHEAYNRFNFAGPRLARLAKALFPEYASPSHGSVWRQGIIKELEQAVERST